MNRNKTTKNRNYHLGIDVGSVSTNLVLLDEDLKVCKKLYLRTQGQPIKSLKEGFRTLRREMDGDTNIISAGTTGSGRQLASVLCGADIEKNEITAHAVASLSIMPDVKTILEIGGQDSKIIIIRNGVVYDFAMNTVCAAGTGSFLDRQAARLNIHIADFGDLALRSKAPVRIAGRCAVFAESDMIHKQQTGHSTEDIANGLCQALVRNYINNLGKGKHIEAPIVFQGGVAANKGIVAAFERELGQNIIVPEHYDVMGAIGSAILAKENAEQKGFTEFCGLELVDIEHRANSFECKDCSNACEVIEILSDNQITARWGDRCGKWSAQNKEKAETSA